MYSLKRHEASKFLRDIVMIAVKVIPATTHCLQRREFLSERLIQKRFAM